MSDQQLDDVRKHAIWLAHDCKCIWCGILLLSDDKEIDHIIPEKVKPKILEKLKSIYGLPNDFEVTQNRNLAPACRKCNIDKSNRTKEAQLSEGLMWKLEIAASKVSKIEKTIQDYTSDKIRSKIQIMLTTGIRKGNLEPKDINHLHKHGLETYTKVSGNIVSATATATSFPMVDGILMPKTSPVGTMQPHQPADTASGGRPLQRGKARRVKNF